MQQLNAEAQELCQKVLVLFEDMREINKETMEVLEKAKERHEKLDGKLAGVSFGGPSFTFGISSKGLY